MKLNRLSVLIMCGILFIMPFVSGISTVSRISITASSVSASSLMGAASIAAINMDTDGDNKSICSIYRNESDVITYYCEADKYESKFGRKNYEGKNYEEYIDIMYVILVAVLSIPFIAYWLVFRLF